MNHPWIKFALRAAITMAAIYAAFSQVSFSDVIPHLKHMEWALVLAAWASMNVAQIAAAMRTSYYLSNRKIHMPLKPAVQLQYIGSLFNALLPGGAGGDAYKAWWLKKNAGESLGNMVLLMIASRLNGLWTLGVVVCLIVWLSKPILALVPYGAPAVFGVIIGGTVAYHMMAYYIFKEKLCHQYTAGIRYSLPIQLFVSLTAWCLLQGLGFHENAWEYLALFQLSCVLAMLPISIGGLGIRELALLHGSALLALSPEHGVALALTYSILNVSISLLGAIVYFLSKPTVSQRQA